MKSIFHYLNNFINFDCLVLQERRCRWNWNFRPNRMQRIYQMIASGMQRKRRCYQMRTMTMKDLWAALDRVWTTGSPWTAKREMRRRRMNWPYRKTKRSTQTPPRNAVRRRSGWRRRGWPSWRSGGWRPTPVSGTGCTGWTTRSTSCASTCRAIRRRRSCRRSKLWDWRATTSAHWPTSWRRASNRKPSHSPKHYLAGCRRTRSTWSPVPAAESSGPDARDDDDSSQPSRCLSTAAAAAATSPASTASAAGANLPDAPGKRMLLAVEIHKRRILRRRDDTDCEPDVRPDCACPEQLQFHFRRISSSPSTSPIDGADSAPVCQLESSSRRQSRSTSPSTGDYHTDFTQTHPVTSGMRQSGTILQPDNDVDRWRAMHVIWRLLLEWLRRRRPAEWLRQLWRGKHAWRLVTVVK